MESCSSSATCRLMCKKGFDSSTYSRGRVRSGSLRAAWYSGCCRMTSRASASMPATGWPARYLRHASKNVSLAWSRVGWNILGLRSELAQVANEALRAPRLSRQANVAAMQDEPVVRVLQVLGRRELEELQLDLERVLPGRDSGAVGDPEDVCIDRYGRLPERRVQDHVRSLAAHARQCLEGFAILRHGATVSFKQDLRKRDHVLRLHAVETDALDVLLESGDAELHHLFRSIRLAKEFRGREVDRLVGRLRRQHHRDQELVRRRVAELGGGIRIRRVQAPKDFVSLLRVHGTLGANQPNPGTDPVFDPPVAAPWSVPVSIGAVTLSCASVRRRGLPCGPRARLARRRAGAFSRERGRARRRRA